MDANAERIRSLGGDHPVDRATDIVEAIRAIHPDHPDVVRFDELDARLDDVEQDGIEITKQLESTPAHDPRRAGLVAAADAAGDRWLEGGGYELFAHLDHVLRTHIGTAMDPRAAVGGVA